MLQTATPTLPAVSQHRDRQAFRRCDHPLALGAQAGPCPARSHSLLNSQMRAVSNDQMTRGACPRAQPPPPKGSENGAGTVPVATSTTHPSCCSHRHMTGQETRPPSTLSLVHKMGMKASLDSEF